MNGERETVRDEAGGAGESAHVEQTSNKVDKIIIDTVDHSCLKAEKLPDVLMATDNSATATTTTTTTTTTRPESRVVGNENGLKIKISTALGKSWVNSSHLNKPNGDGQIRNGVDTNIDRTDDSQIATTSKSPAEVITSDVNGLLTQSNSVLSIVKSDDELSPMPADLAEDKSNSAATSDVKLKLNCTSRGGKLLSHWEIMNKCLNKKMLFEALKVAGTSPFLYECPICHYTKSIPQHVLLHMRSHKDLTSVFEFYQSHEQLPPDAGDKQDVEELDVTKSEAVSCKRRKQKLLLEETMSCDHPKDDHSSTLLMASGDSDNSTNIDSDLNEEQNHSDYAVSKRKQRRRRRRRSQMEEPNSPASVVVSEYLTSDDSNQDLRPTKSVTDIEDHDSDELGFSPRRLRKRKHSGQLAVFGNDFISDPYDSHQSMDEIFDGMHYEFLDESVSAENPHFCQYCGTKLTRGSAIARHYAKHHRKRTSQSRKKRRKKKKKVVVVEEEVTKNGTASATCQTTLSYNINSSLLSVEQEKKIAQTLQQLETNVNKVLEYFVKDVEVLISIGWPHRNVSDLLVDILDRCNIAPVCRGSSKLSMLKCVRQNVSELLSFCIKDEVMESNGWKSQLVDNVIQDLIEKVEERSSSDQELC